MMRTNERGKTMMVIVSCRRKILIVKGNELSSYLVGTFIKLPIVDKYFGARQNSKQTTLNDESWEGLL